MKIRIAIKYVHNEKGFAKLKSERETFRTVKRRLLNGLYEDSHGEVWEAEPMSHGNYPGVQLNAVA